MPSPDGELTVPELATIYRLLRDDPLYQGEPERWLRSTLLRQIRLIAGMAWWGDKP